MDLVLICLVVLCQHTLLADNSENNGQVFLYRDYFLVLKLENWSVATDGKDGNRLKLGSQGCAPLVGLTVTKRTDQNCTTNLKKNTNRNTSCTRNHHIPPVFLLIARDDDPRTTSLEGTEGACCQ